MGVSKFISKTLTLFFQDRKDAERTKQHGVRESDLQDQEVRNSIIDQLKLRAWRSMVPKLGTPRLYLVAILTVIAFVKCNTAQG